MNPASTNLHNGIPVRLMCFVCLAMGFGLLLFTGCQSSSLTGIPRSVAPIISAHSGLCPHEDCKAKAQNTADQICVAAGLKPVRVVVVQGDAPRAYAVSPNWVLVSESLIQDQDLLAAAIAHEISHLFGPKNARALDAQAEHAADCFGQDLLVRSGMNPDAMQRLLTELENDPSLDADARSLASLRRQQLAEIHHH